MKATRTVPLAPADAEFFGAARLRAARMQPYLASAVFSLIPVPVPGYGTFGVDRWWRVYVDMDQARAWGVEATAAVLLHEANHVLRDHQWNLAGDAAINDGLLADGLPLPDPVLPSTLALDPGGLEETYFRQLGERAAVSTSVECGSGSGGERLPVELDDDTDEPAVDDVDATAIRRGVAHEVTAAQVQGIRVSPGLALWAKALLTPQVSWRSLLRSAVGRPLRAAYGRRHPTWQRPDRRGDSRPDFPSPGSYRERPEVAVVIDTSASMSTRHRMRPARRLAPTHPSPGPARTHRRGWHRPPGRDRCRCRAPARANGHRSAHRRVDAVARGGSGTVVPRRCGDRRPGPAPGRPRHRRDPDRRAMTTETRTRVDDRVRSLLGDDHLPECPHARGCDVDDCDWCRWAVVTPEMTTLLDVGTDARRLARSDVLATVPGVVAAAQLFDLFDGVDIAGVDVASARQTTALVRDDTSRHLDDLDRQVRDATRPGGPVDERCRRTAGAIAAASLQAGNDPALVASLPPPVRACLDELARSVSGGVQLSSVLPVVEHLHWRGMPELASQPEWSRRPNPGADHLVRQRQLSASGVQTGFGGSFRSTGMSHSSTPGEPPVGIPRRRAVFARP